MIKISIPVGLDGSKRYFNALGPLKKRLCAALANVFSFKKNTEEESMHFVDIKKEYDESLQDTLIDISKEQFPEEEFSRIVDQCKHDLPFAKHVSIPALSGRYKFVVVGSDKDNTIHLISDTSSHCEFVLLENGLYFGSTSDSEEHGRVRSKNPFVYGGGVVDVNHELKTVTFSKFSTDYGFASQAFVQWMMSLFQEKGWLVYFANYGVVQR